MDLGVKEAVHHLAHIEVGGAVVLDEHHPLVFAGHPVDFLIGFVDGGVGGAGVVEESGAGKLFVVAGQPDQVVVAGDDPELVQLVPVDGILLPQPAIVGVRVVNRGGAEHIVGDIREYHTPPPAPELGRLQDWDSLGMGRRPVAVVPHCLI